MAGSACTANYNSIRNWA